MIDATFIHTQGYKFNIRYKTKGRFKAALRRSKDCKFDNAVDYDLMLVINNKNIDSYINS